MRRRRPRPRRKPLWRRSPRLRRRPRPGRSPRLRRRPRPGRSRRPRRSPRWRRSPRRRRRPPGSSALGGRRPRRLPASNPPWGPAAPGGEAARDLEVGFLDEEEALSGAGAGSAEDGCSRSPLGLYVGFGRSGVMRTWSHPVVSMPGVPHLREVRATD
ncbi:hypothetical protein MXAN_6623 [Myxococcus xanthus DK 1622]|uniref:Uncharacterized protein n=1 Tax=Myxococcus xanthus (strain DK1622) TaxID=246197 RepID=Q1CXY2_MYXXD|nr:hypothetical protein MXAN_6623 [Myxococcus xanthus DK 1622]